METAKLKKFAQFARRSLIEQVSAKLKLVLAENSAARRESVAAIKKLDDAIHQHGKEQVIERVAYIWFNRFCALRFMDVNRYTRIGVVSPAEGQFQPEILAEAKMGHIDEELIDEKTRQLIFDLLSGKAPSDDAQGEAYRKLVVAACNHWNRPMPFLFERIEDYTELLMPDDLLSGNSILAYTREAMTPDACQDVEVIGWLYQFYISEKKDEVFDGLKKNKKITPENIPAATQLFTPHWIVRYLVENSLGRLWLLNRPDSKLAEQMDYYIKPEQPETDFLLISKPEEIKVCDPACGSGHMLTYAFDLLYAIYEEEGYEPAEIPEKILTHNLYGVEIDERAGELAAFALTMKARSKQRRFFNKGVKPNICVLEKIDGTTDEHGWTQIVDEICKASVDRDDLVHDLTLFAEADNFGSLLRPRLSSEQAQKALAALIAYDESVKAPTFGHFELVEQCKTALRQADYLSPKYHVVVANPPYMGSKGMNGRLGAWAKANWPNSKSDLFAMFIERGLELAPQYGYSAMVTMQSWMFLSSYESLRAKLMAQTAIESMAHMANMVMGIAFGTAATVWKVGGSNSTKGSYCYIEYEDLGARNKPTLFPPHNDRNQKASSQGGFYRASAADFKKIPGSPIAYWISENMRRCFVDFPLLSEVGKATLGMNSTNNLLFVRAWFENSINKIDFTVEAEEDSAINGKKWFPYNKGGDFRKWYGNREFTINWENNGLEIHAYNKIPLSHRGAPVRSKQFQFKESATWSFISSSKFGVRYSPDGSMFDVGGSSYFGFKVPVKIVVGFLCSHVAFKFLNAINPTLNFQVGNISSLPISPRTDEGAVTSIDRLIALSKLDWNSYETSWDFTSQPLLNSDYRQSTLKATYQKLRAHWREMTLEMQRLEEENNRIFIDAYGLQDELMPDVPLNEITLTCNPYYRYGKEAIHEKHERHEKEHNNFRDFRAVRGPKEFPIDEELEAKLLADTMRELVSYAVGCMFGRYALDKPGLILANQGETIDDYYKKLSTKDTKGTKENQKENFRDFRAFRGQIAFPADEDNVIPLLDGDWFTDDISERFREFLKTAFGAEYYEENLRFVEESLNIKGKRNYSIRDYFLGEFYADHVKRYKKRPIYWLFSSPKGSFNALIYMHRYRPDTVSVVLNDYLREFRTKLTSHKNRLEAVSISASASQGEKTKALKEIEKVGKMITEMEEYEREVLYPLATEQKEIDLDDGVKVNYPKFGAALKKIVGLEAKEG